MTFCSLDELENGEILFVLGSLGVHWGTKKGAPVRMRLGEELGDYSISRSDCCCIKRLRGFSFLLRARRSFLRAIF